MAQVDAMILYFSQNYVIEIFYTSFREELNDKEYVNKTL